MSQKRINVRALPRFVIKKDKLIKPTNSATVSSGLLKNLSLSKCLYAEDMLYESKNGDFLKLDGARVSLFNKINLVTSSSLTIAKYFNDNHTTVEKTSENVAKLIGQWNYDAVYLALCSLEDEPLKIRALISLLTVPTKTESVACQTEFSDKCEIKSAVNASCQTDETCIDIFMKKDVKHRRRVRKLMTPYVVTEKPIDPKNVKKCVINPAEFQKFTKSFDYLIDSVKSETSTVEEPATLPELVLDEESMDSIGKISNITCDTTPELLKNPLLLIQNIEKVTQEPNTEVTVSSGSSTIKLLDGTVLEIPFKPEDHFHIATPDIMTHVQPEHRRKLLWYQAYIDWKYCLTRDSENYLPLHVAAMNGDVNLLKRHCIVLKSRQESVDIPSGDNMTALQMSISGKSPQCTAMLLQFGADPLVTDDQYRTCYHEAAESTWGHLKPLLERAANDPLEIIQQNEELWAPELERPKSKEYLAKYLLNKICVMIDDQGYTPLMVASKVGNYENVKLLIEASPGTINIQMPNCGNTALYNAVAAACIECNNSGNKSKLPDDFRKTIELLVENGADPSIDNDSSSNINTLLTDLNIPELSMLIANKLTSINCFNGEMATPKIESVMLFKEQDGTVNIKNMNKDDNKKILKARNKSNNASDKSKSPANTKLAKTNVTDKLIILEDVKIDHPLGKHKLGGDCTEVTNIVAKKIKTDTKLVQINTAGDFMNNFKSFLEKSKKEGGETSNSANKLANTITFRPKAYAVESKPGGPSRIDVQTDTVVVTENTIKTTKIEMIPEEISKKIQHKELVKVDPSKRLKIDKNKEKLDTT